MGEKVIGVVVKGGGGGSLTSSDISSILSKATN